MKARNILIFITGAIAASIYLSSCGVDRWAGYAEQTKTDRWIDDTMRVWYYWYEDIPNTNKLNYFTDPITFFKSLLSSKDGKNGTPYSTIDTLQAVTRSIPYTDYSYGLVSMKAKGKQEWQSVIVVVPVVVTFSAELGMDFTASVGFDFSKSEVYFDGKYKVTLPKVKLTFFNQRSLHVFITKLRHKLAKDDHIRIINVRGVGYKLITE